MTLHPLGYHRLVNDDLRRGFWWPHLDDRARGYAIISVGPQPPAILARMAPHLLSWRPLHG